MKNGNYNLVLAPEEYPGKKYRNRYCSEHVLIYWKHYGIVPSADEIIHHKDGNKANNSINNLELMKRSEHAAYHMKKVGKVFLRLKCPGCGNEFDVPKVKSYLANKGSKVTCCCRACVGYYTALSSDEKEVRRSEMFIKEFRLYKN